MTHDIAGKVLQIEKNTFKSFNEEQNNLKSIKCEQFLL